MWAIAMWNEQSVPVTLKPLYNDNLTKILTKSHLLSLQYFFKSTNCNNIGSMLTIITADNVAYRRVIDNNAFVHVCVLDAWCTSSSLKAYLQSTQLYT